MSLLERKVLFAGIIVLIIIIVLSVLFLYQPKIKARVKIRQEISQLRSRIEEMKRLAKEAVILRQKIVQLEAENKEFLGHIVPREELLTLLRQLGKISERYNLQFLEIRPPGLDTLLLTETAEVPIRPVPFEIRLQGRYLEIGQFIQDLKNLPYFVKVPEIEISGRDELRPAVEVRVLVNVYTTSLVVGRKTG